MSLNYLCSSCGHDVAKFSRECPACGTSTPGSDVDQRAPIRKWLLVAVRALVTAPLVLVGLVLLFIWSREGGWELGTSAIGTLGVALAVSIARQGWKLTLALIAAGFIFLSVYAVALLFQLAAFSR